MALTRQDAYRRVKGLRERLQEIAASDSEQEVTGIAVPVLDAAFASARLHLAEDDPLRQVSVEVISPEVFDVEDPPPLRAVDALIVAQQLEDALYQPPVPVLDQFVSDPSHDPGF